MPSQRTTRIRACAKLNLTLRVGPRQSDGFHEVATLFQSIALHDTLTVTARPGAFTITCDADGVPRDESNIVWRAAEAIWRARGRDKDMPGAAVRIEKQIPVAAGLGGGSADAAAALVAFNALWNARLSRAAMVELAERLGSDVPFFLRGGTALGLGRGQQLFPVDDVQPTGVVLLKPSFGVSAGDAYRWCDEDRAANLAVDHESGGSIDVGWLDPIVISNDLQDAVARRHPIVRDMVAACRREGALAASMTGSGSVVFGLFSLAGASRAARRLRSAEWQVISTTTASRRKASLSGRSATGRGTLKS